MAAKGTIAKENLLKRFSDALGEDYIGPDDTGKKWYFWSKENGENLQVCITMTVPKTPIAAENRNTELVFDDSAPKMMELGVDEKATLDRLMKELGL